MRHSLAEDLGRARRPEGRPHALPGGATGLSTQHFPGALLVTSSPHGPRRRPGPQARPPDDCPTAVCISPAIRHCHFPGSVDAGSTFIEQRPSACGAEGAAERALAVPA